ncbi:hypothetical protein PV726_38535 [Streptomyces europaeiscabiei]|uniref:hypothetical protein n=1 Tax=Streptomyces europaeiscabiei TaxID=146819 RepID=UPI0029B76D85|nr:hypothetical protein [Streptomyces europaeiscabiei]MDX3696115.1 hypothetical protein [Streptomyces europaeiscabiei]
MNGKLRSPAKPGPLSLRVTLTDADGNTLTQTIHRAYRANCVAPGSAVGSTKPIVWIW